MQNADLETKSIDGMFMHIPLPTPCTTKRDKRTKVSKPIYEVMPYRDYSVP